MAKIRHEINIIDAIITGANDDSQYIQIDTTQYNGTVTYYFEIIASIPSGSENVTLRRVGTTTDDATIAVTGSTTPIRFRSSSFTPPAGQTQYMVHCASTNASVKAARIVVIQDATTLTNTESQIEIGNEETGKTNTTDAALTNPKYWYYDSAKWDGTLACYAEVTWKGSGTMYGKTIKLQEDNGSFGSWTDKVTIVNASTSSTLTRSRVSFTPVSGRNYRIVSSIANNMETYDIYNAKIIVRQNEGGNITNGSTGTAQIQGGSGNFEKQAQSYKLTVADTITGAKIRVSKTGSPADNLILDLVSTLDGSVLATASVSGASLSTSTTLVTFTFAAPYALTANTTYYLQLSRSGSRDTSNYYTVETDGGINGISTGNHWFKNSGSWTENTGWDFNGLLIMGATGITKLEEQYLLANTAIGAGTGLQNFDTYFDPAEWSSVTNAYYHEAQNVASGTSDAKLQTDPNGTPADVSGSTITDIVERERSSSLTMPGTAQTIDVNQTGT